MGAFIFKLVVLLLYSCIPKILLVPLDQEVIDIKSEKWNGNLNQENALFHKVNATFDEETINQINATTIQMDKIFQQVNKSFHQAKGNLSQMNVNFHRLNTTFSQTFGSSHQVNKTFSQANADFEEKNPSLDQGNTIFEDIDETMTKEEEKNLSLKPGNAIFEDIDETMTKKEEKNLSLKPGNAIFEDIDETMSQESATEKYILEYIGQVPESLLQQILSSWPDPSPDAQAASEKRNMTESSEECCEKAEGKRECLFMKAPYLCHVVNEVFMGNIDNFCMFKNFKYELGGDEKYKNLPEGCDYSSDDFHYLYYY